MSAIAFNERQLAWLKTRINQAASQVLVVPIWLWHLGRVQQVCFSRPTDANSNNCFASSDLSPVLGQYELRLSRLRCNGG
jgi:hypothetical protein